MNKIKSAWQNRSLGQQVIKVFMILALSLFTYGLPAIAAFQPDQTYYWVHVPFGGSPIFYGDTQGPFYKDEYPIAREASARVLRVEKTNVNGLEHQLEQNHLSHSVVDLLVGKTSDFKWLGLSGGFTLVYHQIPEPRSLKPVQTEYVCLLGGETPQVIFGVKVQGQLSAEEYNEGASGLTKDSLVVLGEEFLPSAPAGKVTEFWVYSNTTCLNVDTNN
ncbi:hypothetical protein PCC7424_5249 [Gloeothece citriformis PCC 7424]|uniref:Uncharacterized protein n=1 Tax=Gloeothece citriformis (strain PCC 7424) TaxID=65393 RepID=B7KIB0_GLOC7|nr:hypothetical protein [Gloeothece citriformis]ACK73597.1 hypothetical protein PCC7424_5249 [Gloeothece citriformis PCC 7424]